MTPRQGATVGGVLGTAAGFTVAIVADMVLKPRDQTAGIILLSGLVVGAIAGAMVGAGNPSGGLSFTSGPPCPCASRLPSRPVLSRV